MIKIIHFEKDAVSGERIVKLFYHTFSVSSILGLILAVNNQCNKRSVLTSKTNVRSDESVDAKNVKLVM